MKRYDYVYNPVVYFGVGLLPLVYLCTSAMASLRFGLVLVIAMLLSFSVVWLFKPLIYENVRIPCFVLVVVGVEYFVDSVVSEFWVNNYSGLANSIYYLFVATIIIFMLEFNYRESNTKKAYLNCINIGLEYYVMMFVVGILREVLGFGKLFGGEFLGDGSEFFASSAGALLIVIVYSACYIIITKKIKDRIAVKNKLTDRYLAYIDQNCLLDSRMKGVKPQNISITEEEGGNLND